MTQNSTDIESPTPTRKRSLSVLPLIAIIAVSAIFIAWVLTADGTQRWLTARRTTHELEQSVRQAPDTPWPFYELGVRYARAGRLPEATKLFERARQAAPESADVRFALGKAYVLSGSPQAAVTELRHASELDSRNAAVYRYLAIALRLARDRQGALVAARRATDLDPRNADGWYQYGILFTPEEGHESEGRPFLKRAVDLSPNDGVYALAYGRSLVDGAQFADAIPYLKKAVEMLPQDPNAHFFLGLALHRNGKSSADTAEAITQLQTAVKLAPSDYKGHFELGNVLEEESRFAEALPEFELAARLNPSLSEIWFHVSRMADRAGQREKAAKARARFTEIRKYHVEFTTLVHQLQQHPNDTSLELSVGEVLEKQGKPREAATQYADVLRREPENTRAKALLDNLRQRMHWPASAVGEAPDGGAP